MAADRAILRDALGIAIASGAYAISFGAISTAAGLSLLQTCTLSVLMFTGASQFALVGVLGAGGSVWAGAATAKRAARRAERARSQLVGHGYRLKGGEACTIGDLTVERSPTVWLS